MKELSKADVVRIKELDAKVKNKFRFMWLDEIVTLKSKKLGEITVKISDSIVKVDLEGKVLCNYCNDVISYGGKGKIAIVDHIKSSKHVTKIEHRRSNYSLSAQFTQKKAPALFPLFKAKGLPDQPSTSTPDLDLDQSPPTPSTTSIPKKPDRLIPLCDRTANMEAMIISFMAENNISFTVASQLVGLIKECAADSKALSTVSITRCSAAYKLKYGLADFFHKGIVESMKKMPFSLNIDEASASNNNKKVFSILVSYFNTDKNEIVVEHFASVELVKCDSLTLFQAIEELMDKDEIPWINLQSCLSDSCSVMRGTKSGLETRLRAKAPHLLDIDGDSCHHVHNAVKTFCEPFNYHVERLFLDLHTDFKWSSESRALMTELSDIFGIKFTTPERFIPHRWLSCYDLAISTLRLYDMFRLYYSASCETPMHIKQEMGKYVHGLNNPKAEMRAHQILSLIKDKSKTMTKDGRMRKERIREKLFSKNNFTQLVLHFYVSALPMLKEYVLKFQGQEPLIHKLHDHQVATTKKFLACFIKAEKLDVSPKELSVLDVDKVSNHLELKDMFIGKETEDILEKEKNLNFLITVNKAFRQTAKHLLQSFPLDNSLLVHLSALDPSAPNHTVVGKCLKNLSKEFSHYLTQGEQQVILEEIKNYNISPRNQTDERADVWWSKQVAFPTLQKLSRACLTIFHGPQVEGSFSKMKDTMKTKSANMDVSTFSAIQTVKYSLKSRNINSIKCFSRKDILYDEVDSDLVRAIKGSSSRYAKALELMKQKKMEKRKALDLEVKRLQTKQNAKILRERAVKQAFKTHITHQQNSAKKRLHQSQRNLKPQKRQKL